MTSPSLGAADVDLSDLEFWKLPWARRDQAFAALRRERPIAFFEEPLVEGTAIEFPKGPGYYALTRHRDVVTASRHPEVFALGPRRGLDHGPADRDDRVLLGDDLDRQP